MSELRVHQGEVMEMKEAQMRGLREELEGARAASNEAASKRYRLSAENGEMRRQIEALNRRVSQITPNKKGLQWQVETGNDIVSQIIADMKTEATDLRRESANFSNAAGRKTPRGSSTNWICSKANSRWPTSL